MAGGTFTGHVTGLVAGGLRQCHDSGCSSVHHQQTAVRVECRCSSCILIAEVWFRDATSQELHWLKVEQQIEYKLAVLIYRCLHGLAPQYLAKDLRRVADLSMRQRLRSASTHALVVPQSRLSTVSDRAFPMAAAWVWNSLPDFITASTSLPMFKRHLKTLLFTKSY